MNDVGQTTILHRPMTDSVGTFRAECLIGCLRREGCSWILLKLSDCLSGCTRRISVGARESAPMLIRGGGL
eukprot:scaffold134217_cov39-Tisochrysis_lutea.AAC.3